MFNRVKFLAEVKNKFDKVFRNMQESVKNASRNGVEHS